jgi:hypothetical protein
MLRRNMIMVENAETWPKFRLLRRGNPTRDASPRPDLNSFAAAGPCRAQAAPLILEHMKKPVKTEDSAKQRRSKLRAGAAWTIDARVEAGGGDGRIRFGSVEIVAPKPPPAEVRRNIEKGRTALARAMDSLTTPGVELKRGKGIAFYAIDPERPDRLIRTIDGRRDRGVFEKGQFKVVG